jgi:hypothetical protein
MKACGEMPGGGQKLCRVGGVPIHPGAEGVAADLAPPEMLQIVRRDAQVQAGQEEGVIAAAEAVFSLLILSC